MRFEMESMEQRLLREYFGGDEEKLADAEKRLRNHEPIAYILGETVFFREYYYVTPAVLIPRPDTERVVEKILRHLPENGKMLELCTGSGCISISSLCSTRHTTSVAVDISGEALAVAKKNADRNHVSLRIRFVQGMFFLLFFGSSSLSGDPTMLSPRIRPTCVRGSCRFWRRSAALSRRSLLTVGRTGWIFIMRSFAMRPRF